MAIRNYVGARYVPKFADPVEWKANTSYEAMVIVTYNNSSYTSKIPVPPTVGNPAENSKYWALTGNYNAQVEQYRKETVNVSNKINGYVTPEMFGAKGDGITDDTTAIQNCINNSQNKTILIAGTYLTTFPINISGEKLNIDGTGNIIYSGTDYALKIKHLRYSTIHFTSITAENGGGIDFESTTNSDWTQYINIYIDLIRAKTNCYKIYKRAPGWVNEIRIFNTALHAYDYPNNKDATGVYIDSDVRTNGIYLQNIGIENIGIGVFDKNGATNSVDFDGLTIAFPRIEESFTTAIKTEGYVNLTLISGTHYLRPETFDLSNHTTGSVYGRISVKYNYKSGYGTIMNGSLIPADVTTCLEERFVGDYNYESTSIEQVPKYLDIRHDNLTITLGPYYNFNGVNAFYVHLPWGYTTTFQNYDKTKNLILDGSISDYFIVVITNNEWRGIPLHSVDTPVTKHQDLVITGGNSTITEYCIKGNLCVVNLRLNATSDTVHITGFPKYTGDQSYVALNYGKGSTYINKDGEATITGLTSGNEYLCSAVYFII